MVCVAVNEYNAFHLKLLLQSIPFTRSNINIILDFIPYVNTIREYNNNSCVIVNDGACDINTAVIALIHCL